MVRSLTQHTYDALMMDIWPRSAAIVDFGIDSAAHLGALQSAIKHGGSIEELDATIDAAHSGDALNAFVQKYARAYRDVSFETVYDLLPSDADDD